jgi:probable HAF family extracellular repeat protein
MVDLGTLTLGGASSATDVNGAGQVVGYGSAAQVPSDTHAFSWTQAGGMVDLGTLGGDSFAAAVNDAGQVVGFSATAVCCRRNYAAFSWTQAGGMVELDLGGNSGAAVDVNDAGQVVGASSTAGGEGHAFSWTQAGGIVDLGTLGGNASRAAAVNERGQIGGWAITATGEQHATLWQPAGEDTTPPTLIVPADIAVDATSPVGATVSYTVSASDDLDPAPLVSCTPPSESLFAIGDTAVHCTASDAAGNSVDGGFTVHVRAADEQLGNLQTAVTGVGPGRSLAYTVALARWLVTHDQPTAACVTLARFQLEVRAQAGKKIPAAEAAGLIADAARIGTVLGCPTVD